MPTSLKNTNQQAPVHENRSVGRSLLVGMCEILVCNGLQQCTCLGVGSCVVLVLADYGADAWGVAHITLPKAFKNRPAGQPAEFADTGIIELIRQVTTIGASVRNLKAVYAGGAEGKSDVGARNTEEVGRILSELHIPVIAFDCGGTSGRTLTVQNGIVTVETLQSKKELCKFQRVPKEEIDASP